MSELAGVAAALFVGGALTIEDATGSVLSRHPITATAAVMGDAAWLTVAAAQATGTGIAARYTVTSATGRTALTGTPALDRLDIEEGADVILEPIRLEAAA